MLRTLALLLSTSLACIVVLSIPNITAAQSPFSSVKMELTLTQEGTSWKAEGKFNIGGSELIKPAQDLKVNANDLSFFVEIEGVQVRFVGRLSENKLGGTLEATEKGARVASGTWSLQPVDSASVNGLSGKWIGAFSAQMIPAQQADPNFDTRVVRPAYTTNHPKVLFDEAHNNIHTASGLYKPFADLITSDGFGVVSFGGKVRIGLLLQANVEVASLRSSACNSNSAVVSRARWNSNVQHLLGFFKIHREFLGNSTVHIQQW